MDFKGTNNRSKMTPENWYLSGWLKSYDDLKFHDFYGKWHENSVLCKEVYGWRDFYVKFDCESNGNR